MTAKKVIYALDIVKLRVKIAAILPTEGLKMKKTILIILIIVLTPVAYLKLLDAFFPVQEYKFIEGFRDYIFGTDYSNPRFVEESFNASEWNSVQIPGYSNDNTGFTVENGSLVLYARFDGWGKKGIEIEKSIPSVNTTDSPFMVVRFKANSSEGGLMFSFAVLDDEGNRYDSLGYHVSENWIYAEFDLREKINGIINCIALRFTNDFDPSIVSGTLCLYVQKIGIYKDAPVWKLSYNAPAEGGISSKNNVLEVFAKGNISSGTIVTAQRSSNFSFSLKTYRYLKVSIKTSSIDVSARITIWTEPSKIYVVLLKTYNDKEWHTEIVDLSFCGVAEDKLFMLELGLMQVYDATDSESAVYYKELSFCKL
jgi:hypothetical protein